MVVLVVGVVAAVVVLVVVAEVVVVVLVVAEVAVVVLVVAEVVVVVLVVAVVVELCHVSPSFKKCTTARFTTMANSISSDNDVCRRPRIRMS